MASGPSGASSSRSRRRAPAVVPASPSGEAARPDRVPPHNLDAEEGLLGACLLADGREVLNLCLEAKLSPEAFFKPSHQVIFFALRELFQEGVGIDEIVLADRLAGRRLSSLPEYERDPEGGRTLLDFVGGDAGLSRLTQRIESTLHARHWLEIVRQKHILRRLIGVSADVVRRCYDEPADLEVFIDEVEREVFEINQDRVSDTARPIKESIESAERLVQKLLMRKGELSGVPSGYKDLDALTFGFQSGEMIVLAARPSMGKTALALNFAENVLLPKRGHPVKTLFFSLEMTAESLAFRMLCGRARVSQERVRESMVSSEQQHQLAEAARELKRAPLFIDDSSHATIMDMRAKARRLHSREGLGMVVVDYLQLISGTDGRAPREQQIAEISRGIKAMAKELKLPVIVLSQLNRDSEREKRAPRLSDLRESGSIEQDADVVMLLYSRRDKEKDGDETPPQASDTRELMIAKQRNGPVGNVSFTFIRNYTRFENYAAPKIV